MAAAYGVLDPTPWRCGQDVMDDHIWYCAHTIADYH